jgi:hypothetical protein
MSTEVPFRDEEDEEQPTNASPWMLDTGAHANQMRYVCRQLKEETTGLELRFNKLTFFDMGYGHAIRMPFCSDLIKFSYLCAPVCLQKIKHITICDIDGKSYDASRSQLGMDPVMNATITSLCRNYPSMTVTIESWPYPTLADTYILSKHLATHGHYRSPMCSKKTHWISARLLSQYILGICVLLLGIRLTQSLCNPK